MVVPAVIGGIAGGMGMSIIMGPIFAPITAKISQIIWPLYPILLPPPGTLVIARIKGAIEDGEYKSDMAKQGFSGETADAFLKSAEQILGPGELLGMLIRGVINPTRFAAELTRLGLSEESASDLEKMAEQLLGAGDLLGLLRRGVIDPSKFSAELTRSGISAENISDLEQMAETLLDPGTLIRAKFRGAPIAGSYESEMARAGYTPQAASTFEEVSKIIGGPSDMIRWAVREVFTPEIVTELGLADEFPTEFIQEAAKIGMEEKIAKNEWMAHWVLPSVGQGFQMLHRRATKPDGNTFVMSDMERLLRVQDVMPFFRGLLTQIAYNPFTRVDVRRMHKMGVLSDEETKFAYMDNGFNEEKASKMLAFTIQFNSEGERDLTKSEIMRALARGVIDESLTLDLLMDIGTPVANAEIIIATQLAKLAMDTTDELADIEIDRYVDGIISEDDLQGLLALLDLMAPQIELLMAKSRRKKRRAEKMPSKADVLRWHVAELIDRESADVLLERIGIREEFRSIYLQEVTAPEEGE